MASAIYILDDSYDIIISRLYKHELDSYHIMDNFKTHIGPSISSAIPIVQFDGINYIYVIHHNLVFLSVSLDNVDLMLLIQFLFKFVDLIKNYLNTDILDKELIQSNYILIYQLFDEVIDFGIPQLTDFSILREYLKGEDKTLDRQPKDNEFENDINYSISRTSTTKISWRPKGIFYKKNEIFIDLIETVSLHYYLQTHEIKKNYISGEINSKCYLSGMPICKLGLNELLIPDIQTDSMKPKKSIIFDNINFHQCVELSNLDKNLIQFMPPDGFLKLINYSIVRISTTNLKPIIVVEPLFRIFNKKNRIKLQISVDLKTFFKKKYLIKNLEINIPLYFQQSKGSKPLFIDFNKAPKFKSKIGNVVLSLDKSLMVWKIPSINGNSALSIFTNSSRDLDDRYHMISEFELIWEPQLRLILDRNEYYDKLDSNSLYYTKLAEEVELIRSKNSIPDLISLNFEIPYLSYSGLKVDFLKIMEDQYNFQSFPWVRYLIKNDDYWFKLGDRNFSDQVKYSEFELGQYVSATALTTDTTAPTTTVASPKIELKQSTTEDEVDKGADGAGVSVQDNKNEPSVLDNETENVANVKEA